MIPHEEVWEHLAPIHARILEHPFVTGLTDGTLARPAFARYVVQDELFLAEYARALALCGARAADLPTLTMFCNDATGAIGVERELHARLLDALGVGRAVLGSTGPTPTCAAYTDYLLRTAALGERHEAIAAVLPCYWIYWEVGRELARRGSRDPLYAEWITTYADPGFGAAVEGCRAAFDAAMTGASDGARQAALAHAVRAARYEWMFWDAAYRDEQWPV